MAVPDKEVVTHKSRNFPVTLLTRATGAGPIPSTVAVSPPTSVNPLCSDCQQQAFFCDCTTHSSLINRAQRFRLFAIASNSNS